jgi:hypothetical protein
LAREIRILVSGLECFFWCKARKPKIQRYSKKERHYVIFIQSRHSCIDCSLLLVSDYWSALFWKGDMSSFLPKYLNTLWMKPVSGCLVFYLSYLRLRAGYGKGPKALHLQLIRKHTKIFVVIFFFFSVLFYPESWLCWTNQNTNV